MVLEATLDLVGQVCYNLSTSITQSLRSRSLQGAGRAFGEATGRRPTSQGFLNRLAAKKIMSLADGELSSARFEADGLRSIFREVSGEFGTFLSMLSLNVWKKMFQWFCIFFHLWKDGHQYFKTICRDHLLHSWQVFKLSCTCMSQCHGFWLPLFLPRCNDMKRELLGAAPWEGHGSSVFLCFSRLNACKSIDNLIIHHHLEWWNLLALLCRLVSL